MHFNDIAKSKLFLAVFFLSIPIPFLTAVDFFESHVEFEFVQPSLFDIFIQKFIPFSLPLNFVSLGIHFFFYKIFHFDVVELSDI